MWEIWHIASALELAVFLRSIKGGSLVLVGSIRLPGSSHISHSKPGVINDGIARVNCIEADYVFRIHSVKAKEAPDHVSSWIIPRLWHTGDLYASLKRQWVNSLEILAVISGPPSTCIHRSTFYIGRDRHGIRCTFLVGFLGGSRLGITVSNFGLPYSKVHFYLSYMHLTVLIAQSLGSRQSTSTG